jgi:hypothetical protein
MSPSGPRYRSAIAEREIGVATVRPKRVSSACWLLAGSNSAPYPPFGPKASGKERRRVWYLTIPHIFLDHFGGLQISREIWCRRSALREAPKRSSRGARA